MSTAVEQVDRALDDWLLANDEGARPNAGAAIDDGDPLVRDAEAALLALALDLPPAEPTAELRERLLDKLDSVERFEGDLARVAEVLDVDAAAARDLLGRIDVFETETVRLAEGPWYEGPVHDSWISPAAPGPSLGDESSAYLMRVESGVAFPEHTHHGAETFVILQGACRESDGRVSRAGESFVRADGTSHDFVVLDGPPLVVLVVLEGHIELSV